MISSVAERLSKVLETVYENGGNKLDIWLSGDLRRIVLFHVSAYNLERTCHTYITEVLYPESMMRKMWNPSNRARRALTTTNVLECPIECAPLATNGDYWCNWYGGASLIGNIRRSCEVQWFNIKWLFFGDKSLAVKWLQDNGYVRFDRLSLSQVYNKLVGNEFYPTSELIGDNDIRGKELIEMLNQWNSYVKSKETDMFLDTLFLLKNSDSVIWKSPIYVSKDFKKMLLFEYGNFTQPCRTADMRDTETYIHVYDIGKRKVVESYEYTEAILSQYAVLQGYSWPMLLNQLNSADSILPSEKRLYRDAFYSCKWRFMYNEINTQVDE